MELGEGRIRQMQRVDRCFLLLVPGLYLVSFLLPAIPGANPGYGYEAFLLSFLCIFDPHRDSGHIRLSFLFPLAWMANPLHWLGYYFLLRGKHVGMMWAGVRRSLPPCSWDCLQLEKNRSLATGYGF
jgi:hypothetical protein